MESWELHTPDSCERGYKCLRQFREDYDVGKNVELMLELLNDKGDSARALEPSHDRLKQPGYAYCVTRMPLVLPTQSYQRHSLRQ